MMILMKDMCYDFFLCEFFLGFFEKVKVFLFDDRFFELF